MDLADWLAKNEANVTDSVNMDPASEHDIRDGNLYSIDFEDRKDVVPPPSMTPRWPGQKYCNCIHTTLSDNKDRKSVRNLVVCIDGTANQFGDKNSNVVELYSRLEKDDKLQRTFYNSGIGTYSTPSLKSWNYYKQVVGHKIDLAIAWCVSLLQPRTSPKMTRIRRFEKILLSAYQWLCELYKPGDRIFLFGFSRGAYQVRALSGMIEKVGLIHEGNEAQIPFAYELYRNCQSSVTMTGKDVPESSSKSVTNSTLKDRQTPDKAALLFKNTFCRGDVKVHFVGVWDTVSSVGVARKKELPLTTSGMKHVCFFRHALALDERRVKFLPEYARGGIGPAAEETEVPRSGMPHSKEVWFMGTHSDIGGGNIANTELLNNSPALRWMTREAILTGLLLNPSSTSWKTQEKAFNESLTLLWRMLEILPLKHLHYDKDGKDGTRVTRQPHLWHRRVVTEGQLVHRSVKLNEGRYKKQLPDKPGLESDDFDHVTNQIRSSGDLLAYVQEASQRKTHLDSLHVLFGSFEAQQALMNLSQDLYDQQEATEETISLMDMLTHTASGRFRRQHLSRMPRVLPEMLSKEDQSERYNKCATDFLEQFGTEEIFSIRRKGPVTAFAFSKDGKQIVCGTQSGNIFVREVETGAEFAMNRSLGEPAQPSRNVEHSDRISCIAFSPDRSKIISGSLDKSLRIWETATGKPGPTHVFDKHPRSFAMSDDGLEIIVSLGWEVIHIRNPLSDDSHKTSLFNNVKVTRSILSITLSCSSTPGQRLVAASGANIVLLDPDPRKPVNNAEASAGLPATGTRSLPPTTTTAATTTSTTTPIRHRNAINTVAFSDNGSILFAGSLDGTISIWDPRTGNALAMWAACTGHDVTIYADWLGAERVAVTSLAVAPGKNDCIAVGLKDGKVKIYSIPPEALPAEGSKDDEEKGDGNREKGDKEGAENWDREKGDIERSENGNREKEDDTSRWWTRRLSFSGYLSYTPPSPKETEITLPTGQITPEGARKPSTIPIPQEVANGTNSYDGIKNGAQEKPGPHANGKGNAGATDRKQYPPLEFKKDLQYSTSSIVSVAYSPDGQRIAACHEDGLVIVWDVGGPAGPCILKQLTSKRWFS
ncbi:hypothetical protein VNI00_011653 [Paramarasmius palmivorus]|uniref:T6SS Phospholipase effector Tle1-like catalytic domain-containing protein n=1 Tax=Paramarasmius palmivorus TaxID=297713 RepID=A0AAW0CD99_9AGAR